MSKVVDITDAELKILIDESDKFVFIDFAAEWCGPCRMVAPVIEDLSIEYNEITFVKVNIDENPLSTAHYGVRTIPTFIMLKNGDIIFRHSGAAPKNFFTEKISSIIK